MPFQCETTRECVTPSVQTLPLSRSRVLSIHGRHTGEGRGPAMISSRARVSERANEAFRCTPRCVRWSSRCCAAGCWRAARRTRCCGRGPACGAPGVGRAPDRSRDSSSPGSCGKPRGIRGWSRRRWAGWARCWSSPPRTPPPPPRHRSRKSRITTWWCTCNNVKQIAR